MNVDPHHVLGVTPDAEPEVIDAAYRALMKKYHPDKTGGSSRSDDHAKLINAAYCAIRAGHTTSSQMREADEPVPATFEQGLAPRTGSPPKPKPFLTALIALLIILLCASIATAAQGIRL